MSTFVSEQRYLENVFLRFFGHRYYKQHEKEIKSTSPYAVTDKLPKMRVVDNPIISGKGHTDSISSHSTVYRGFFGGVKGVANSVSGGGGNWKLDTEIRFDHISMCPVTGREFTDEELEKYHEKWISDVTSFAKNELHYLKYSEDMINQSVKFSHTIGEFKFGREELLEMQIRAFSDEELDAYIHEHELHTHGVSNKGELNHAKQ